MPDPTVTFVIPCFNHGRFVADAVRSCLAQKGASLKVVLVNDGSDDGTTPAACDDCTKLDPARVVVMHQENRGLSAARNAGAAEARKRGVAWAGTYLTFLDADDFIDETFVSKLHAAIVNASSPTGNNGSGPGLGEVSHAYCQERLIGLADMTWAVPDWDPMLMMVTNLHPVTTLVRRECFEAVGGFDDSMRGGYEDWDLWLKFVERGWRGVRVREPLFTWRRHSHVTMIVEAGQQHGRLFGHLVRNHPDLYRRHADDLHILANTLLRRGEGNWLDESGEAIVQRDMRRHIEHMTRVVDGVRHEAASLGSQLSQKDDELRSAGQREQGLRDHAASLEQFVEEMRAKEQTLAAELSSARQEIAASNERASAAWADAQRTQQIYETKPIVRLSKLVYRVLDHMPGAVKKVVRGTVHGVANTAAPQKKTAPHSRG
jgi:glycosyltransferase involved in cell wall biosynthesis